MKHKKNRN